MFRLFSFRGRTSRLGFWRVQVLAGALVGVVMFASLMAIHFVGSTGSVLFAGILPIYVFSVATGLRRLHDRGKNGWWLLMFIAGPLAGGVVANQLLEQSSLLLTLASLLFDLSAIGLWVWGLVEIGFRRGDPQPNRYGDIPARGALAPS